MSRQSEPDEGERLGASGRTYSSRSFFLLSTDHPLRRTFIDVIEWPWFDRAVLLLICLNCAFLAVQGPPGYGRRPTGRAGRPATGVNVRPGQGERFRDWSELP